MFPAFQYYKHLQRTLYKFTSVKCLVIFRGYIPKSRLLDKNMHMSIFVLLARLLISPCYYQHIMMKLFNLCQFNKQKWYYVHLICIYLINSLFKHFLIFLRLDFFFFSFLDCLFISFIPVVAIFLLLILSTLFINTFLCIHYVLYFFPVDHLS